MSRKSKLQVLKSGSMEVEEINPIVIKSGALSGIFCHYTYEDTVAPMIVNTVNIKSAVPVHADLKEKFESLNAHLAVICEEIDASLIGDITKIEKFDPKKHAHESLQYKISCFRVFSFSLKGVGDSRSVVLSGSKELSTKKEVTLTTPSIKFDSNYDFMHDLIMAIDDLVEEIELYRTGKQAPTYVQQDLGLDEENYSEPAH